MLARSGRRSWIAVVTIGGLLAGCATAKPSLPSDAAAYQSFPPPGANGQVAKYVIGPLDTITVTVFQEPDLTAANLQVDSGGAVTLPLIGSVQAAGKTPTQFGGEIAQALSHGYLVNPQVSVIVQESASQKVTVEGSVTEPGVYEIKGRTTLLDALAMAKGTSRVAALDDVVVFRDINGQRMGALFNIKSISRGEAADPEILGNDTVVVGLSNIKAAWRDILTASPLVAAFRPFN